MARRTSHGRSGTAALAVAIHVFFLICPARAHAQTSGLEKGAPARRLALIVGNRTYANLTELPSVGEDLTQVEKHLRELQFKVTRIDALPSETEFEFKILPAFGQKIGKGDLVVFYFSGHGFSYGSSNYLAPSDLPGEVLAADLPDRAVSVESVADYLTQNEPGLTLMLIDACRSIGGFVVSTAQTATPAGTAAAGAAAAAAAPTVMPLSTANNFVGSSPVVGKGFQEPASKDHPTEILIAYAAKSGRSALASSFAGQMSMFTAALSRHIETADVDFKTMYDDVIAEVGVDTNYFQEPGMMNWTSSTLFMKQTALTAEQERVAWLAARSLNSWRAVSIYLRKHAVSPYAPNARQWLSDNPDRPEPSSPVSPISVEQAWQSDTPLFAAKTILPGFDSFGFPSSNLSPPPIKISAIPPGISAADRSDRLRNELDRAASQTIVTTSSVEARATPSLDARVLTQLAPGTALRVYETVRRATGGTSWLTAVVEGGDNRRVFLPAKLRDPATAVVLGENLKEVVAPPMTRGLTDLVEPVTVESAIRDLVLNGKQIQWVSLATSPASNEVGELQRAGWLVHVAYILSQAGIPSSRITSVSNAGDLKGEGVRVRFFGK